MLRRTCVTVMCLAALTAGCRRKAQPQPAPTPQGTQAPAGFVLIPGAKPAAYITEKPVTVAQFSDYCKQTGEPLPAVFAKTVPDDPAAGLSKDEATRYATWNLLRLPTEAEWTAAAQVTGQNPYPWPAAGEAPAAAQTFLVRDWTDDADKRKVEALKAREAMVKELLTAQSKKIAEFQTQLAQVVDENASKIEDGWKSLKPALFDFVKKQKELTEKTALQERGRNMLTVLDGIAKEKLKIVNEMVREGSTQETLDKAKEEYKTYLNGLRDQVQKTKEQVLGENQKLSQEALALTAQLEDAGERAPQHLKDLATVAAEEVAAAGKDLEKAVQLRERLQKSLDEATTGAKNMGELLADKAALAAADAQRIQKKLEALAAGEDVTKKLDELSEKIKSLNEEIKEEFDQETHLFKELRELADVAARKKALESELEELQKTLKSLQERGAAPEQPDQPPQEEAEPAAPETEGAGR